jgi:hypothetical protein
MREDAPSDAGGGDSILTPPGLLNGMKQTNIGKEKKERRTHILTVLTMRERRVWEEEGRKRERPSTGDAMF